MRRLAPAVLLALLTGACAGGRPVAEPVVATPSVPVIAFVARDGALTTGEAERRAAGLLAASGFRLSWRTPAVAGDVVSQAALLTEVLRSRPRAVVLMPVSYRSLLPYLRVAHDAGIPIVVVDAPRDELNPTFVASFVSAGDTASKQVLQALPQSTEVLVLGEAESQAAAHLAAGLRALAPSSRVELAEVPSPVDEFSLGQVVARHGQARTLVLADSAVASALVAAAPGRTVVTAVATDAIDRLMRGGSVAAAVTPSGCAAVLSGMRIAVAAAENRAAEVPAGLSLPTVLSRGSAYAGCPA